MATDWHSYVAGFFDGEGSITIARVRSNGRSDYHCIHVYISQRAKYRAILDRIASDFGGHVILKKEQTRVSKTWAEGAVWQLQEKGGIRRFLLALQPHCIVKAEQIRIALEFLDSFQKSGVVADDLGRIRGRTLTADEVERRERLRLKMREANLLGPTRAKPSQLPPLDVQHQRLREDNLTGNRETISKGENRPLARLTDDIVRSMRAEYAAGGVTLEELGTRYGVHIMTVHKAVHRKTWKHIP